MLVTFALLSVPPIETWSPLPVTLNVPSSFTPPVVVSVAPSPKLNVALRAISTDLTEADVVRLSLPLSMTATSPDAAAVPVLQSPGLPVQLPLPFQKSVAIARSSCDVGPKPTGSGISPPGSCRDGSRCAHRVSPTPAHRREQARRPCVYAVFGRLQARVYVVKLHHCNVKQPRVARLHAGLRESVAGRRNRPQRGSRQPARLPGARRNRKRRSGRRLHRDRL